VSRNENDIEDTSRTFFCGIDSVLNSINSQKVVLEKINLTKIEYKYPDRVIFNLNEINYNIQDSMVKEWLKLANIDNVKVYETSFSKSEYLFLYTNILGVSGLSTNFDLILLIDITNKNSYYLENFFYRSTDCFYITKEKDGEILNVVTFIYGDEYNLTGNASLDVTEHALMFGRDSIVKEYTTSCICGLTTTTPP